MDLNKKSNLIKIIVTILTLVNYGLFFGCFKLLAETERVITITIIAGFCYIYITEFIGMCIKANVNHDSVVVWAWYSCCAHLAAAILLLNRFDLDDHRTASTIGVIDGVSCLVTSVLSFCDWLISERGGGVKM